MKKRYYEERICMYCTKSYTVRADQTNRYCSIACSKKTHGMTGHPIYKAWDSMKERCLNTNSKKYKDYGGRGITINKEWLNFDVFYADVCSSWKPGLTLDRKDNNGNYNKDNFRWATHLEQNRNRRNTPYVILNGGLISLAEAAERCGLSYGTAWLWYKNGKPLEPRKIIRSRMKMA
jgi:hypothetical protein